MSTTIACDLCGREIRTIGYKVELIVVAGQPEAGERAATGDFCPPCLGQRIGQLHGHRPDFAAARKHVDPLVNEDEFASTRDLEERYDNGELQANVDHILGVVGRKTQPIRRAWGFGAADTALEMQQRREARS